MYLYFANCISMRRPGRSYGRWVLLKSSVPVLILLAILSADEVIAQVSNGAAVGWVVAEQFSSFSEIAPGQNSTAVNVGPGVFQNPVPITQVSPDGSAWAQTEYPNVRTLIDSTNLPIFPQQEVAYAGAYFGDSITFTGGVGSFELALRWSFDGAIKGAEGSIGIDSPALDGPFEGSAAVNFRVMLERFGDELPDLSQTDLFKDYALEPTGSLEVPFFDPADNYGGPFGNGPSSGNFLFEEFDEYGNPTGGFQSGWLTDQNADQLAGLGGGARFTWEYGVPLNIGVLQEGWATAGGVVDFSNTGTFTGLEVPQGTTVTSATGASYNLTFTAPDGDFNDDGAYDCSDVDALTAAIAAGNDPEDFDVTGDGTVDGADLADWLVEGGANNPSATGGGAFLPADGNLDGVVDASDFNIWNDDKFQSIAAFCSGDYNADGAVDGSDFNVWNENKFSFSDSRSASHSNWINDGDTFLFTGDAQEQVAVVPEPSGMISCLIGFLYLVGNRRMHLSLREA